MVVAVDEQRSLFAVAGQVDLEDALGRHGVDVGLGGESVVVGADEDVVHIEQDPAIGSFRDGGEKLPLGHRVVREAYVRGDVLDRDATAEPILHALDPRRQVPDHLPGVGKRQKVVQVLPPDPRPAQMIRDPGRLQAAGERVEGVQVDLIQRVRGAQVERHAVQGDRRVRAHLVENARRPSPGNHEVLADGLEPVDRELTPVSPLENVGVMGRPQSHAHPEKGRVGGPGDPGNGGHGARG